MAKPKKGSEFVCEVCGTTLLVTEDGVGVLEEVICCGHPMECSVPRKKSKRKSPKKKK